MSYEMMKQFLNLFFFCGIREKTEKSLKKPPFGPLNLLVVIP